MMQKFKAYYKRITFFVMGTFFLCTAFAQQQTSVSGIVNNGKGVHVPQVSVTAKNLFTNKSYIAITDTSGAFRFDSVGTKGTYSFLFSCVGYKPQTLSGYTLKAGSNTTLLITLQEDSTALGDVVITGFQNLKKKQFSGSAVKLKIDDIKMDGQVDVSRMLEGKAAGVSVENVSGTFGAAPKIRIRGATSITGDNKPLWVVDGVVLEDVVNVTNDQLSSGDPATLLGSSVAGLNANDIETIDILKDAAATAMYGARAMNGVIVITTKKGHIGKTSINYTGNFSTQLKPSYNNYDIMNSADQMALYNELYNKGWLNLSDLFDASDAGVYGKMAQLIAQYDATSGQFGLVNTPDARDAFLRRYAAANTNWFNILFRNQLMQEHNISISSGNEFSQSYLSLNYYNDNGWTIADKVKRVNMNFKNDYKFSDKLKAGFSTIGSFRSQRAPGALTRISNPVEGAYSRDFDINPFSYALNTSRTLTAYDQNGDLEYFTRNFAPFNIIHELQNNYENLTVADIQLQGHLDYSFNKFLTYSFLGNIRYAKTNQENIITENSNMAQAYREDSNSVIASENKFLYSDPDYPDLPPVIALPEGGFYNTVENTLKSYNIRNSLTYNRAFGKHYINLFAGQEIRSASRQYFMNKGYGYQYDQGGVPYIDYHIVKWTLEQDDPYYSMQLTNERYSAFFSSASYSFDNKYNFNINGRYDGTNKLGKSTTARWLPTWSVDGSWNLDQENFMKNQKVINALKLRASYGLTANMGNANNALALIVPSSAKRPYLNEKETELELESLANSQLTWEKLHTLNFGLDGALFNSRLNFSLDVYSRNSFDLIDQVKTSGIGGESVKTANFADMKSNGVEIQIGGAPLKTKDWGWNTNLTMGYNTTKITRDENMPEILDLIYPEGGYVKGYPQRALFSIDFKKLDPVSGLPYFVNEDGTISQNVYFQDQNIQYLKYEGPVDPTLTGGWNNTFRWKDLSLNVFVSYAAGNKVRLNPIFKSAYSDLDAMPKEFLDRWELPGDEAITTVPVINDQLYDSRLTAYPYNAYNYSTQRVANGSFIRLKTISLSYNVPQKLVKSWGLKTASLMLTGYNLWLIASDARLKGQDPEFFNAGGVAQPIQKQFTFTVRVGL